MAVHGQLLASLHLGRKSMALPAISRTALHLIQQERTLSSLCTAEGAQRPCLLENSLQLSWLEPGPRLELAAPCWVPPEGVSQ